MGKTTGSDLLVIGGGVAAALTALAATAPPAGRRKSALAVTLVQADPDRAADVTAASYAFLNPAAADLLPALRTRLPRLTDGSFKRLAVVTAHEGRQAEYASRAVSGYLCDGPKLLKGLLAAARQAGVQIVRPSARPAFFADDHAVHAEWTGGHCSGKLAFLTDPETILEGQAEGLGFRHHWIASRLFACLGQTLSASPARLDAAFGKTRRMVTVWQLHSLDAEPGELTAPTGHDGHAWLMPRAGGLSIGVMLGQPAGDAPSRGQAIGRPAERTASRDPASLMAAILGELRAVNALPRDIAQPVGPVQTWRLPVAGALEIESHVGKRSLAVGLAGGFVSALSGQWLYPVIHAAAVAAAVATRALADPRPQDVLCQFGARWRGKLSDYLRSPNTRLAFLLPLVFGNRQIADRFSRAYLFGENF